MAQRVNLNEDAPVPFAIAARLDTYPTPIQAVSGSIKITYDLLDLQDRADLDRNHAKAVLVQAIRMHQSLIEPWTNRFYLFRNDAVLTTLSNRAVFGSNAPAKTADKADEQIDARGYWDTSNTVPPMLVGLFDPVILPEPAEMAGLEKFIADRIKEQVDPTTDALDLEVAGFKLVVVGYTFQGSPNPLADAFFSQFQSGKATAATDPAGDETVQS